MTGSSAVPVDDYRAPNSTEQHKAAEDPKMERHPLLKDAYRPQTGEHDPGANAEAHIKTVNDCSIHPVLCFFPL
jgi:hypothetical protein